MMLYATAASLTVFCLSNDILLFYRFFLFGAFFFSHSRVQYSPVIRLISLALFYGMGPLRIHSGAIPINARLLSCKYTSKGLGRRS